MHAMIVAHPDDECLWAIEPLIATPQNWEVIVCSAPTFDKDRVRNFERAMALLCIAHRLLGAQDTGKNSLLSFELPNLAGYESILTHNAVGEYGHPHHKLVHARVLEQRPDAICFGWGMTPKLTRRLSDERFAVKKAALACYEKKFYTSWFPTDEALRTETLC